MTWTAALQATLPDDPNPLSSLCTLLALSALLLFLDLMSGAWSPQISCRFRAILSIGASTHIGFLLYLVVIIWLHGVYLWSNSANQHVPLLMDKILFCAVGSVGAMVECFLANVSRWAWLEKRHPERMAELARWDDVYEDYPSEDEGEGNDQRWKGIAVCAKRFGVVRKTAAATITTTTTTSDESQRQIEGGGSEPSKDLCGPDSNFADPHMQTSEGSCSGHQNALLDRRRSWNNGSFRD